MMDKFEVKFDKVLEAARRAADANADGDGHWKSWAVPALVCARLGIDRSTQTQSEYRGLCRLDGQASRAFTRLADEGVLVKVGRGQRSPNGQLLGNESEFWLPAAYKKAQESHAQAMARQAVDRQRWESVRDRIDALGYQEEHDVQGARYVPVQMTLGGWERLLDGIDELRESV